jgi:hypothetical protein
MKDKLNHEWFEWESIVPYDDFTIGKLKIAFADEIAGHEVMNGVRITVRIPPQPDASMRQTQQAIYERAILVLQEALSACDGKSADELRSDAVQRLREH